MQGTQSPFENIFNLIGGFSQGNEKPLKHGFYNAFAMLILVLCCIAFYVLFLILEPFFKPLFWALLVGSILHPIKYKVSKRIKNWLDGLNENNGCIVLATAKIPLHIVNCVSDGIGNHFQEHYKMILGLFASVYLLPCVYAAMPRSFSCLFWQFIHICNASMNLLIGTFNPYIMMTMLVGYIISVYILWLPERSSLFHKMSIFMWFGLSGSLAGLTGSLQVYTFSLLQCVAFAGLLIEIKDAHDSLKKRDPNASLLSAMKLIISNTKTKENDQIEDACDQMDQQKQCDYPPEIYETPTREPEIIEKIDTKIRENWLENEIATSAIKFRGLQKQHTLSTIPVSDPVLRNKGDSIMLTQLRKRSLNETYFVNYGMGENETGLYFKLLFFGCTCVLIWKHIWLLPVTLFFLMINIVKKLGNFFSVWLFMQQQYDKVATTFMVWWEERQDALIPVHVIGMYKIVKKCNESIRQVAYESVDAVSSCVVITGLIFFVICGSVFICIQIYSETIVVVQLSGNLLNSTLAKNSEFSKYLPDGWEEKLDSLLDNAYTYGREGISKAVKNVLKEGDADKVSRVEQQILELWDRVYQSWVSGHFQSAMGPQVDSTAVRASWDTFFTDLTKTPGIVEWVQANVGTLTAIASSVWAPLASNVSLLAGSLAAFGSVVLCGGSALVNFIFGLVVFFTTLFYLLTSSNALYKPVEVITQTQPNFGPRLGIALTVAINQVFRASFKMALFYGLWTWLVHNLFGAKVVYLPSALAAVLGAAPFLGTWLAGLPAALDVWLRGQPLQALLLLVAQAAPMAFLDAAVYKEIRNGGHPYLTGLAIAGGIFYLGPEGAILGPLLLCCLLVVLNLSSTFLRDTPLEERAALHTRVSGA